MGPYIHNIDPIIGSIFGIHLWWYGLSYTLGFLNAYRFIKNKRDTLGISTREVYNLILLIVGGVLFGGRFVEVVFYEWPFYSEHVNLIPAYWLGGMATHGLLFGGLLGIWLFCLLHKKRLLDFTDTLAIPGAFIMGVGRIGNFIDGQIVGSVTSVWWAVQFPDAEGFRHPVVLYDGLKNLLIIPVLIYFGKRQPPSGVLTGIALFLYAFLRIFVDIFREYPTNLLGLATGQVLNITLSIVGLFFIIVPYWKKNNQTEANVESERIVEENLESTGIKWRRLLFASLLIFSLIIPSDWTQDVPARYGKRHDCLTNNSIYLKIDTSPPSSKPPKVQTIQTKKEPSQL